MRLEGLSEKIFLDRYARKHPDGRTCKVGDTVLVLVRDDPKFPTKEVGEVRFRDGDEIVVRLRSGDEVKTTADKLVLPLERTPAAMWDRLANSIASAESLPAKQVEWEGRFRAMLDDWKLVPGGRIMAGAGASDELTLFNCYVVPSPEDSRGGIMKSLAGMTEIMARGGGVGMNLSTLRPRRAIVAGVNGSSSGAVSWGGLFSYTTGLIEQGGCFGPNEKISTDHGEIKASELADRMDRGEVFHAVTHLGLRRINHRFRNGIKPLFRVSTARGFRVDVTIDHKMGVLHHGQLITIPLKDLSVGDETLMLVHNESGSNAEYVQLTPSTYKRSIMSTTLNEDVKLPRHLDEQMAYFLGYFYGDGAVHNISVYSRILVEWLEVNGLLKQKSAEVRVPEVIFSSPPAVKGAFVAGYFDADGSDRGRKGGYGFDSISRGMLQDIQQILMASGILSHINESDRSKSGWHTIFRLCVTGAEFKERFNAFISMSLKNKAINLALAVSVEQLLRTVPDVIVSIEPVGEDETFDFEVEEAHMLCGNGFYTSNSRRGALMIMLNDWHPDLMEFITVKQKMGEVTNANLSVCVSDSFMDAVKRDQEWELVFPDTKEEGYDELWDGNLAKWRELGKRVVTYRKLPAREIWHVMMESAWRSAEPGVVFMERYNGMSNSWYFNPIVSTNPCGEQGLPGWGVCNLSAINVSKFYDAKRSDVDWEGLRQVTRSAVRFLDNVIDKTPYHFEENERNQKNERRIGLGTMGLAELMIKLGIRYGGEESVAFLDRLYGFIAKEAYLASSGLASEKGSFPAFDAELYAQSGFMKELVAAYPEVGEAIRKQGMRNVTVLTQAPTGSTGTMAGTSTGIEPYFAFEYFRQSRLGYDKQLVPIAQEWLANNPGKELPDYFVTAMSLSAEDHIRTQAAIQRWVDSSISKTANCPADFTVEETKRLYELAYDLGCKGVTIYRDGSRDMQVLSAGEKESEGGRGEGGDNAVAAQNSAYEVEAQAAQAPQLAAQDRPLIPVTDNYKRRPAVLKGATYKINTPFGMAYITINDMDGSPAEVFLNVGKAGSDVFAMAEALGRVCSLFLRYGDHGNKVKLLVKHLKGIGGSGAIGFGANRVESIADAVAKALDTHMNGEREPLDVHFESELLAEDSSEGKMAEATADSSDHPDLCPSCGSGALINLEGCKQCSVCGFSKCN